MPAPMQTEPILLFGDLEQGIWGMAVGADDDVSWSVAVGDDAAISVNAPLSIESIDATTASVDAVDALELCRVRGSINVDGVDRQLDLPGIRCAALSTRKLGSVRLVGMWFPDGPSLALAAIRPKSSSGHDRDHILALGAGEEQPLVVEPRLSTTYGAAGTPLRVGVELWLSESEDGDQSSRRVAAEATGASLAVREVSLPVEAYALECHTHGLTGTGIYATLQLA